MARRTSDAVLRAARYLQRQREDGVSYSKAKARLRQDHPELSNPAVVYNAERLTRAQRQAVGRAQATASRAERRAAELQGAAEVDAASPPGPGRRRTVERRFGLGEDALDQQRVSVDFIDPATGELAREDVYMAVRERETPERLAARTAFALAEKMDQATYERISQLYGAILEQIQAGNFTVTPV